jgi:hypothetical protein
MNRLFAGVALAFALTATAATAAPTAAPAPTPTPDAAVMARAKDWFHRIETGNIDRSQLSAQVNAALSDAMIKQVASQVSPLGEPTSFTQIQTGTRGGSAYCVYEVTFSTGEKWHYVFAYDPATTKITGLRVLPAQ